MKVTQSWIPPVISPECFFNFLRMFALSRVSRLVVARRLVHESSTASLQSFEEVQITTPWGQISGKWWGDTSITPVIALHGVFDNAASFDNLAPLLETPSLLCLDLPGHGRSSHLPAGITLHFYDDITFLRYLLKYHFKWEDLVLLGHSFGAALWYHYASIFPDDVKKFISLDPATYVVTANESKTGEELRTCTDAYLELEKRKTNGPKQFTYDEIVEAMYLNRKSSGAAYNLSLTKESCKTLLTRGSKRSSSGTYYFSRDIRLRGKSFGRPVTPFILALAERISCDVLYIRASKGILLDKWLATCDNTIQLMQKKSKRVEFCTVDGNHHVHLEHPEKVAPLINRFLNS